jgi:hypothetical protein
MASREVAAEDEPIRRPGLDIFTIGRGVDDQVPQCPAVAAGSAITFVGETN